jgi:hypothetical protein
LHLWNTLAREYYRQKRFPDFVKILEAGINFKFKDYEGYDKDQMAAYDTLAAYFVQVPDGMIPLVPIHCLFLILNFGFNWLSSFFFCRYGITVPSQVLYDPCGYSVSNPGCSSQIQEQH